MSPKDMTIIDQMPLNLNSEELRERLRLKEDGFASELAARITSLIRAKALFKIAYLEEKNEGGVTSEGQDFKSLVLRKNLDQVERVFPFIITLGPELEKEIKKQPNILDQLYLDTIGNMALAKARSHLKDYLKSNYKLKGLSFMSPGSLKDWALEEQRPFFSLMGDPEAAIGVKLTDRLIMIPQKSISGMFFPTEVDFYNCQLCPRDECPGRKAAYDKTLAQTYGLLEDERPSGGI